MLTPNTTTGACEQGVTTEGSAQHGDCREPQQTPMHVLRPTDVFALNLTSHLETWSPAARPSLSVRRKPDATSYEPRCGGPRTVLVPVTFHLLLLLQVSLLTLVTLVLLFLLLLFITTQCFCLGGY